MEVLYETPDVDVGLQIVKNLNKALLEKYGRMIVYYRKNFAIQMDGQKWTSDDLTAALGVYKKEIQSLEKTINDLQTEMKLVKEITVSLVKQRGKFVSNETDTRNVLSALLTNTIQQNMILAMEGRSDLREYRFEKEAKVLLLERTQSNIKTLEFKKDSIQNIQIIKAPEPSRSPIKPKTRLNVMLAGVVGLFLTVFLAFFVEYISKYKSRETDK